MDIKHTVIVACATFSIFLGGCTQPKSYALKMPSSELESINLPKTVQIDTAEFTLKNQNLKTAEFYLPNEKSFEWSKLVSISFDQKADIKAYKNAFEATLRSGQFGDAKYDFKFINNSEYQGYTIYAPIKGDKNFDNYEINLIRVKKLECGLLTVHYASKFASDTNKNKLESFISQKMPIFLAQIPQIECKQ